MILKLMKKVWSMIEYGLEGLYKMNDDDETFKCKTCGVGLQWADAPICPVCGGDVYGCRMR